MSFSSIIFINRGSNLSLNPSWFESKLKLKLNKPGRIWVALKHGTSSDVVSVPLFICISVSICLSLASLSGFSLKQTKHSRKANHYYLKGLESIPYLFILFLKFVFRYVYIFETPTKVFFTCNVTLTALPNSVYRPIKALGTFCQFCITLIAIHHNASCLIFRFLSTRVTAILY